MITKSEIFVSSFVWFSSTTSCFKYIACTFSTHSFIFKSVSYSRLKIHCSLRFFCFSICFWRYNSLLRTSFLSRSLWNIVSQRSLALRMIVHSMNLMLWLMPTSKKRELGRVEREWKFDSGVSVMFCFSKSLVICNDCNKDFWRKNFLRLQTWTSSQLWLLALKRERY